MSMFTLHAYGTWLPDRPEGYWHHTDGIRPQNFEEAEQYRSLQRHDRVVFTPPLQRFMIDTALAVADTLQVVPICFGSSSTHVHAVAKWHPGRFDEQVRQILKRTLTRRLNKEFKRRTWFVRKGWCQKVESEEHLVYLTGEYLPGHPGWYWSRRRVGGNRFDSTLRDRRTATRYGRGYVRRIAGTQLLVSSTLLWSRDDHHIEEFEAGTTD